MYCFRNKHELQLKLVDSMRMVLEKVTVNSFEMCMKMEIGLLQIVFDHTKPGMSKLNITLSIIFINLNSLLPLSGKNNLMELKTNAIFFIALPVYDM